MSKSIKVDFSVVFKNHLGDTMKELGADGKPEDLTLGGAITNLILQLTSLDNKEVMRAWNLCTDIIKSPKDYDLDADKLLFITECFEKTQTSALIKGQVLSILKGFKEELEKQT